MTELNKEALLKEAKEYLKKAGDLYHSGEQMECYKWATKAVQLFKEVEEWEYYVEARNMVGKTRLFMRDLVEFEEMEAFLTETLNVALSKLEQQSYQIAAAYNNMGIWYVDFLRTPRKAKVYFENMLEKIIEIHGLVSIEAIHSYNNLGRIYQIERDHETTLMYGAKIVDLLEQLNQANKKKANIRIQIIAYANLGSAYSGVNQIKKAKYYLETALQKCRNAEFEGKNNTFATIYRQFSALYVDQKKYQKTLHYLKQTVEEELKYLPSKHPSIAQTYHQTALIYLRMNEPTHALLFLQKSLEINRQFFKLPSIAISGNLQGMGMCCYKQKNYKKAFSYFQEALGSLLVGFQPKNIYENPSISQSLDNRLFLFILGMKSITLFQQFLVEQQITKYLEVSLETLFLYVGLMDFIKNHYQTEHTILSFLVSAEVTAVFDTAPQVAMISNRSKEAYFFCEKAKANLLITSMQESLSKVAANIPTHLLETETDIKSKLTFLEKQIAKEEAKGENQRTEILLQWKSQFFDLHQEYLQLIQQFEQDYPDYYQLKYETKTASIEEIQQSLEANQVMVNYFVGEKYLYIFFVSFNDFEVHQVDKSDDFEKLVNDFLQSIKQHEFEKYAKTAYELYQYLLQPLEMHLIDFFADPSIETQNEAAKKLLIVPHGILSYVPFEALLCTSLEDSIGTKGELKENENLYHHLDYLLLHCEVSYHYSATLWRYLLNQQQQQVGERVAIEVENSFVGFAPVYESEAGSKRQEVGNKNLNEAAKAVGQWATRSEALRSDGSWNPLPHSKTEAQNIAALFADKGLQSQAFLYEQATKEQFQQAAEQSRFLLIAAHGVVNDEQPKLSGLVFYPSGEKREKGNEMSEIVKNSPLSERQDNVKNGDDCILSMEETYHLNLSKTDLVVLSSCESGIGQLAKGEGMMAVNRGFLYAGAKNVVSTLFKVYDKPSSLLTQYLFEGILKGKTYSESLRLAKLRLLKEEEIDVKSWCGFVLIGG